MEKRSTNAVIRELIAKFPFGFSDNPREIRPLCTNALSEIARVFGLQGDAIEPYRKALDRYQQSTTIGNTTLHSGTAANGNSWNGTTTRIGDATFNSGTDSRGNPYSSSCFGAFCN